MKFQSRDQKCVSTNLERKYKLSNYFKSPYLIASPQVHSQQYQKKMSRVASSLLLLLLVIATILAVITPSPLVSAQNIDDIFPLITSLKEEDELDLRGMSYNETQVCIFQLNKC
jgi:hypothetical protein